MEKMDAECNHKQIVTIAVGLCYRLYFIQCFNVKVFLADFWDLCVFCCMPYFVRLFSPPGMSRGLYCKDVLMLLSLYCINLYFCMYFVHLFVYVCLSVFIQTTKNGKQRWLFIHQQVVYYKIKQKERKISCTYQCIKTNKAVKKQAV